MKYVKLGNSGVDVSRVCLGMMSFGKPNGDGSSSKTSRLCMTL